MMDEKDMARVQVFCFRCSGYFGFGLSPESAVLAARKAGMPAADEKHGKLVRLPDETVRYGIDGWGSVTYTVPKGQKAPPCVDYRYDRKLRTWVEVQAQAAAVAVPA